MWWEQEWENLEGNEGTRRKEWTGIAGNKRLANPCRQFNLAANPRENVNKDLATISATLFRSASSRGTRVLARATTLYFRAKIPLPAGPDHVEIVCKASCARCPFLFSRLSPLPLSLLFCYPFRPSTLVIYRGYAADTHGGICTTGDKKKKKKKKEQKKSSPEDPQYYRFASIIRPPPSLLCEQKKWCDEEIARFDAKEVHSAQYIDFRTRRSNGFQRARREAEMETRNNLIRWNEKENCTRKGKRR